MRILLDESVSLACVQSLTGQGHDVTHVAQLKLSGSSDEAVGRLPREEGRLLVTRDRHSTNPIRFPPASFPGIVYIRSGNLSSDDERDLLRRVFEELEPSVFRGRLVSVTTTEFTIR